MIEENEIYDERGYSRKANLINVSKLHVHYRKLHFTLERSKTDYPYQRQSACNWLPRVIFVLSKNSRDGETRGHPSISRGYLGRILMKDERLDLTICVPSSIRNMNGALKRSYPVVYISVHSCGFLIYIRRDTLSR